MPHLPMIYLYALIALAILTGTYFINPYMFTVSFADVADVPDHMVGIVTPREGKPLNAGEIAGPKEGYLTRHAGALLSGS
ncbi:MAG: hypothetical protein WAN26_12705 [Steroidobacteraceae bacterium]